MNKRLAFLMVALSAYSTLSGCTTSPTDTSEIVTVGNSSNSTNLNSSNNDSNVIYSDSSADVTTIKLGSTIQINGDGVNVENNTITVTKGGTYQLNGTLSNGQLVVNASDTDKVELQLNGVEITSQTTAPIFIMNADKTTLTLMDGTKNIITDASTYVYEDATTDEPNAAIFSKDDLKIDGTGSLTVNANYNNGIASKDDLDIKNGNITITAINNGLKGKDSIEIENGTFVIKSGGDAIKSDNTTDTTKGWITINGGNFDLVATGDGIQAETNLVVNNGSFNIETGGGSENSSSTSSGWGQWAPPGYQETNSDTEETTSAKALKAGVNVTIEGGTFNIDSSDDAIHTNDSIVINGGELIISSGDDGIHADTTLEINGGKIDIKKSYEGLESVTLTINDGNIHLVASDDGMNAAGGNDNSAMNNRPGKNHFSSGNGMIYLNGGYVHLDAAGDGIDANGSIEMTNGTVIVNGPTNGGNGILDYDSNFNISGGLLIGAGSSEMLQTPSTSSTQNTMVVNTNLSNGTLLNIKDKSGNNILTFTPSKSAQCIIISSPNLKAGETYTISTGGSSTGTELDGLYTGGSYSGGAELTTLTLSNTVTTYGSASHGMNTMGGGMMPPSNPMHR